MIILNFCFIQLFGTVLRPSLSQQQDALLISYAWGRAKSLGRTRWTVVGSAGLGCGSLTRGADVLCPGLGEDFLGAGDFL